MHTPLPPATPIARGEARVAHRSLLREAARAGVYSRAICSAARQALRSGSRDSVTLRHVLKLLKRLLTDSSWPVLGSETILAHDHWRDVPIWLASRPIRIPSHAAAPFLPSWPFLLRFLGATVLGLALCEFAPPPQLVRLHANIIFPERISPEMRLSGLIAELRPEAREATFSISAAGLLGPSRRAEVRLPLLPDSPLLREFDLLPPGAKVLVCRLAFCVGFSEPALLVGTTCFKSHCVSLLGSSLALAQASPLNTLFLSPLSEAADLYGSIEPHSRRSFVSYLHACCGWLSDELEHGPSGPAAGPKLRLPAVPSRPPTLERSSGGGYDEQQMAAFLEWHARRAPHLTGNARSNARWCGTLLKELSAFDDTIQVTLSRHLSSYHAVLRP